MLANDTILSIAEKFAKQTKQRVEQNLSRRSVVVQLPVVSAVEYDIKLSNDYLQISFAFDRKDSLVKLSSVGGKNFAKSQKMGIVTPLSVYDPLAKKMKPFLGKNRGTANLGFLRRANVYELIKKDYAEELVNNILAELPEIAGKIIVNGF